MHILMTSHYWITANQFAINESSGGQTNKQTNKQRSDDNPTRAEARIHSHHLRYEGEVCGSAVRQEGAVVVGRPRAPVHPQHGADRSGGGGRAQAALGASFPGGGRPLARVHLMGRAEELGVPQLRERHVRGGGGQKPRIL